MDENEEKIESHHYDGIEEHDNPIPPWFTALFLSTIFFAAGYYGYYEFGTGSSLRATYEKEIEARELQNYLNRNKNTLLSEEELFAFVKIPEKVKAGEAIFLSKCMSCHGVHGQGGIGPNITDHYWLHGGHLKEIRKTIVDGVLDKGMPPWEAVLTFDEINLLPSFIRSLRDTHPKDAKAPQGVLVEEI